MSRIDLGASIQSVWCLEADDGQNKGGLTIRPFEHFLGGRLMGQLWSGDNRKVPSQMFAVPSRGNMPTHVVMHQKPWQKMVPALLLSYIHMITATINISISLLVTPNHWSHRVKHLCIAISSRIQTPIYSQKKDPKSNCVLYPCKYPMCNLRMIPVLCFRKNIFLASRAPNRRVQPYLLLHCYSVCQIFIFQVHQHPKISGRRNVHEGAEGPPYLISIPWGTKDACLPGVRKIADKKKLVMNSKRHWHPFLEYSEPKEPHLRSLSFATKHT